MNLLHATDYGSLALVALAMLGTGLISGFVAGLFAVTGSVVRVPILLVAGGLLGVPPEIRMHVAIATSLATALPTLSAAAYAHVRAGNVDWSIWRWYAPGGLIGAVVGTSLAFLMPSDAIEVVYIVLLLPIAIVALARPQGLHLLKTAPLNLIGTAIEAVIGFASALIALGGGVFNVMLFGGCGLPKDRVVGTSAAIAPAIVGPALLVVIIGGIGVTGLPSGQFGYVNIFGFVFITLGALIAAPLGALLNKHIGERRHHLFYGLFVLAVSVNMVVHLLWKSGAF